MSMNSRIKYSFLIILAIILCCNGVFAQTIGSGTITNIINNTNASLIWFNISLNNYEISWINLSISNFTVYYYLSNESVGYINDTATPTIVPSIAVATGCYFINTSDLIVCLKILGTYQCELDAIHNQYICNISLPNKTDDFIFLNPNIYFNVSSITYTGSNYSANTFSSVSKFFFNKLYLISYLGNVTDYEEPFNINGELEYTNLDNKSWVLPLISSGKVWITKAYVFPLSNYINYTYKNLSCLWPKKFKLKSRVLFMKLNTTGKYWENYTSNLTFYVYSPEAMILKAFPIFNVTNMVETKLIVQLFSLSKFNIQMNIEIFPYNWIYYGKDPYVNITLRDKNVYLYDAISNNLISKVPIFFKCKYNSLGYIDDCKANFTASVFSTVTKVVIPVNITYHGKLDPPVLRILPNISYNFTYSIGTFPYTGGFYYILYNLSNLDENSIYLIPELHGDIFLFSDEPKLQKINSPTYNYNLTIPLVKVLDTNTTSDIIYLNVTLPTFSVLHWYVYNRSGELDGFHKCKYYSNNGTFYCVYPNGTFDKGALVVFSFWTDETCFDVNVSVMDLNETDTWIPKQYYLLNPCECEIKVLKYYYWCNNESCQNPANFQTIADQNKYYIYSCIAKNFTIQIESYCPYIVVRKNLTDTKSYNATKDNVYIKKVGYGIYNITIFYRNWSKVFDKNILIVGYNNSTAIDPDTIVLTPDSLAKIKRYGDFALFDIKPSKIISMKLNTTIFANVTGTVAKIPLNLSFVYDDVCYIKNVNCCKNCTYNATIKYDIYYEPNVQGVDIISATITNCPTGAECKVKYFAGQKIIRVIVNDTKFPRTYNLTLELTLSGPLDWPVLYYNKTANITAYNPLYLPDKIMFNLPVIRNPTKTYLVNPSVGPVIFPLRYFAGWKNCTDNEYVVAVYFKVIKSGTIGTVRFDFSGSGANVIPYKVYVGGPYESLTTGNNYVEIRNWNVSYLPAVVLIDIKNVPTNSWLNVTISIKDASGNLKHKEFINKSTGLCMPLINVNLIPKILRMKYSPMYEPFKEVITWYSLNDNATSICFITNISYIQPHQVSLQWYYTPVGYLSDSGSKEIQNIFYRFNNNSFVVKVVCLTNSTVAADYDTMLVIWNPFVTNITDCFGYDLKDTYLKINNTGDDLSSEVYFNLSLVDENSLTIKGVEILDPGCTLVDYDNRNISIKCNNFPHFTEKSFRILGIQNDSYWFTKFNFTVYIPKFNFIDNYSNITWPNCGPAYIFAYLPRCKYPVGQTNNTTAIFKLKCWKYPWNQTRTFGFGFTPATGIDPSSFTETFKECGEYFIEAFNISITTPNTCRCIINTTETYGGHFITNCKCPVCDVVCSNKPGSIFIGDAVDLLFTPEQQCFLPEEPGNIKLKGLVCNLNKNAPIRVYWLNVTLIVNKSIYNNNISIDKKLTPGECSLVEISFTNIPELLKVKQVIIIYNISAEILSNPPQTFYERDYYILPKCKNACIAEILSNYCSIHGCDLPAILELNVSMVCDKYPVPNYTVILIKYEQKGEIIIKNLTPIDCLNNATTCKVRYKINVTNINDTVGWIMPIIIPEEPTKIEKRCGCSEGALPYCIIPVETIKKVKIKYEDIESNGQHWCYCPGMYTNITLNITSEFPNNLHSNISIWAGNPPKLINYSIKDIPSCGYRIVKFNKNILSLVGIDPLPLNATAVEDPSNFLLGYNYTELPICDVCYPCFQYIWWKIEPSTLNCNSWKFDNTKLVFYNDSIIIKVNISVYDSPSCPDFDPKIVVNSTLDHDSLYYYNISCEEVNSVTTPMGRITAYNITYHCRLEKVARAWDDDIPPINIKVWYKPTQEVHLWDKKLGEITDICDNINKTCVVNGNDIFNVLDIWQRFDKEGKLINKKVICAGSGVQPVELDSCYCCIYNGVWTTVDTLKTCFHSVPFASWAVYHGTVHANQIKNEMQNIYNAYPWNTGSWATIACNENEATCLRNVILGKKFLITESKICCGGCGGEGKCLAAGDWCLCSPGGIPEKCITAAVVVHCIARPLFANGAPDCGACNDLSNAAFAQTICNKFVTTLNTAPDLATKKAIVIAWIKQYVPEGDEECNILPGWICKLTYYGYNKDLNLDNAWKVPGTEPYNIKAGSCVPAALEYGKTCSMDGLCPENEWYTNQQGLFKSKCETQLTGSNPILNNQTAIDIICDYNRTKCILPWSVAIYLDDREHNFHQWQAWCIDTYPCFDCGNPNHPYQQIYVIAYIGGKIEWCRLGDRAQGLAEVGSNCDEVMNYCGGATYDTMKNKSCSYLKLITEDDKVYLNIYGSKVLIADTVELSKDIVSAFGYVNKSGVKLAWMLLKPPKKNVVIPEIPIYGIPILVLLVLLGMYLIERKVRRNPK